MNKKLIYLASPYSCKFENVKAQRVRQVTAATARLIEDGHLIFSPILHSHPLTEFGIGGDWEVWKAIDTAYISKADEVWVLMLAGWVDSVGVTAEIEIAKAQGKIVRYIGYPSLIQRSIDHPQQPTPKVIEFPKAARQGIEAIGLCGYAQSGKDTVGKFLVEQRGYTRISFADGVREALLALNPDVQTHFACVYSLQDYIETDGWDIAKNQPEIRELLQRMGTEVGREIFGQNCWIDIARRKTEGLTKVVFTDVRFPNEVEFVKLLGGTIYKIEREGVKAINDHPSESAISDSQVDEVIENNGTIEQLYTRLAFLFGVKNERIAA